MDREIKEIRLEDMVSFAHRSGQIYEAARLQRLMYDIEKEELASAVITRPVDNGKHEVIYGHSRVEEARTSGHEAVKADVRPWLSDDDALELFFDTSLSQQAFLDRSYSQRFKVIKFSELLMRKNSRQGQRTDLDKETSTRINTGTSTQIRPKLDKGSRPGRTRDQMARRLGLSTATFSKYRRIIKLPDDMIQSIAGLLDEKRITFEAAYIISGKRVCDMEYLLKEIRRHPDKKIDLDRLKELPPHDADAENGTIYPVSKKQILKVLVDSRPSGTIAPTRRKKKGGTAPQQAAGK